MQEYEIHPAAMDFPPLSPARFAELKANIKSRGQQVSIRLFEGKILDGRNRYRACVELGIEPGVSTEKLEGNPYWLAWSFNGARRDMSDDLRANVYLEVEDHALDYDRKKVDTAASANKARSAKARVQPRESGGEFTGAGSDSSRTGSEPRDPSHGADEANKTRTAIATESGINSGALARASALRSGAPELAKKVIAGEIKPAEAARLARRAAVAGKVRKLPEGKHRVIYADPPWQYGDARTGLAAGAAEDHYPTMKTSEICALDVKSLAADDAVLFCWGTFPLLEDALEVVAAWGFDYKTAFIWDKMTPNMGHYHRCEGEILICATRGSCVPESSKREEQIVRNPRGEHSEKPEAFRDMIDRMYPSGPRIELFRRGDVPKKGWKIWGGEVVANE